MCAKFGYILGKPGMMANQLSATYKFFAEDYQGGCKEFGKPRSGLVPNDLSTHVTRPDIDIKTAGATTPQEQAQIRSCIQCRNFVDENTVRDELGWSLPLCRATGKLLFPFRYQLEAKNCSYRGPGPHASTTSGLSLRPQYEEMFVATQNSPISAYIARQGQPIVEPDEYVSDAPVSNEDSASGVRAWRLVGKGEPGTPMEDEPIYLPVMDKSIYTPEEQYRIPRTGGIGNPEWFFDHSGLVSAVALAWMLDETPSLEGEPGTGKTELMRHVAWLCQMPFEAIKIEPQMSSEELLGKVLIEEHNGAPVTVPVFGRLSKAFTSPWVTLADEWNSNEEIRFVLRGVTDNSKEMVADWWDGRSLEKNPMGIFALASNPSWDFRNTGVKAMAAADGDRLDTILLELPPPNVERLILTKACEIDGWVPEPALLDTIMAIAQDIRALSVDGTIPITWNIRPQKQVIRKARWVNLLSCYLRAVGNRLDPDARKLIVQAVKDHIA